MADDVVDAEIRALLQAHPELTMKMLRTLATTLMDER